MTGRKHLRDIKTEEEMADWVASVPEAEKRRQYDEFMRDNGLPTAGALNALFRNSDKTLN